MAKFKVGDIFRENFSTNPKRTWTVLTVGDRDYIYRVNFGTFGTSSQRIESIDAQCVFAITPLELFVQDKLKALGYAKI